MDIIKEFVFERTREGRCGCVEKRIFADLRDEGRADLAGRIESVKRKQLDSKSNE
jgi:hypothetical protein